MKKKLLMGLILCLMIFNVACSKGNKEDNNKDTSQTESQIESTTKDNLTESTSKEENNSQNLETSKEDKKVTLQDSEIKEGEEVAIIKTSMGDIKVRFFKEQAPKAVENFITHAKNGYYDGVKFHRVINEFMIQSGDPLGNGTGGESIWGEPFENEIDLQLRHFNGALSMANTGMPNSNGSQFFIVQNSKIQEEALVNELKSFIDNQDQELQEGLKVKDVFPVEVCEKYLKDGGSPLLDGGYTVFGQVYEGMDIVNKIAAVEVKDNGNNEKSLPVEDIIIEKVEVFEYKK